MATTLNDQYLLAHDTTFIQRVAEAIVTAAIAIASEAESPRIHLVRKVLLEPARYAGIMAVGVATDTTVASQAGTPFVQASVTDAAITNAVTSQWTAYAKD